MYRTIMKGVYFGFGTLNSCCMFSFTNCLSKALDFPSSPAARALDTYISDPCIHTAETIDEYFIIILIVVIAESQALKWM